MVMVIGGKSDHSACVYCMRVFIKAPPYSPVHPDIRRKALTLSKIHYGSTVTVH